MGGFFAGLAGGLAGGLASRRQREHETDMADRRMKAQAYSSILENPNATPEARQYAFDQIISIGEGTDGKKGGKPSPMREMIQPLLNLFGAGQDRAGQEVVDRAKAGAAARNSAATIPPPPGATTTTPATSSGALPEDSPIPPTGGAPAPGGVVQGWANGASTSSLPPVPGTPEAAAPHGRPGKLFYTPEEKAELENKIYLARHRGIKEGELQIALDAIPKKIEAAAKAKGQALTAAERQTLINAEFGIRGVHQQRLVRDVDGAAYGHPGSIGTLVTDPVSGTTEFIKTGVKPGATERSREQLIKDLMSKEGLTREQAETKASDLNVTKVSGQAEAAAARPAEVKARTTTQGALTENLRARTGRIGQENRKDTAKIEADKDAELGKITTDYSKRRDAVEKGTLPAEKKTKRIQELKGEEAAQKQLAQTKYEKRAATVAGAGGKKKPGGAQPKPVKVTTRAKVEAFATQHFGGDYQKAKRQVESEGFTVKD